MKNKSYQTDDQSVTFTVVPCPHDLVGLDVIVHEEAEDGQPEVCYLRNLTPETARKLGRRLIKAADYAETKPVLR